jgi:hypothetical protein
MALTRVHNLAWPLDSGAAIGAVAADDERLYRDELRLTHDLMALTLGVRRARITVAANTFDCLGSLSFTK